jgi:hypothetical protein
VSPTLAVPIRISAIRALLDDPPLIGPHTTGVAEGVELATAEGVTDAAGVVVAVGVGVAVPLAPPHAAMKRTAATESPLSGLGMIQP